MMKSVVNKVFSLFGAFVFVLLTPLWVFLSYRFWKDETFTFVKHIWNAFTKSKLL